MANFMTIHPEELRSSTVVLDVRDFASEELLEQEAHVHSRGHTSAEIEHANSEWERATEIAIDYARNLVEHVTHNAVIMFGPTVSAVVRTNINLDVPDSGDAADYVEVIRIKSAAVA